VAAPHKVEPMASKHDGREYIAGPDDAGRRLDKILRVLLEDRPLSEIYAALRKGGILVNEAKAGPELRIAEDDRIFVHASLLKAQGKPFSTNAIDGGDDLVSLADILVLATADLLFINKPRGELSQDAAGDEARIAARVRAALSAKSSASLSFVPGPLHRLDRNTTGILTFPRSAMGARAFSALLRGRKLRKLYLALVDGEVKSEAEWRDLIARDGSSMRSSVSSEGEEAWASMRPLLSRDGKSLILVELHSGLTHQIRVQASSRGLPLSGDAKYGGTPFCGGYLLHACAICFPEPPFPDVPNIVSAPLPNAAQARLERLFGIETLTKTLDSIR
jgi:23S rRNA pseudouridine955/2504/2580 synthase